LYKKEAAHKFNLGCALWESGKTNGKFTSNNFKAPYKSLNDNGFNTDFVIKPANTPVSNELEALIINSGVAVNKASESQITASGLVLGSNNSNRVLVSGSINAVPALLVAVVGVVTTEIEGIFGAFNLGLRGGELRGYWVHNSKADLFSANRIIIPLVVTIELPPPTDIMQSTFNSFAICTPLTIDGNGELASASLNTATILVLGSTMVLILWIKFVFVAIEFPQTIITRFTLNLFNSVFIRLKLLSPAWILTGYPTYLKSM
jgi:hypothetical protein